MRHLRLMVALLLGVGVLTSCARDGEESVQVVAFFTDVGDLVEGGQVQVRDVEVGSIDDIALVTRGDRMLARVSMTLAPDTRVPSEGLEAVVRQTSLLGEQFVELLAITDAPPFVTDTVTIPVTATTRRTDVETFLSDLSGFIGGAGIEDLNRFTHAQALILEDRANQLGSTIEELRHFTDVLSGRRFDISAAIAELAGASETLVRNQQTLDEFLDSLDSANQLLADEGDQLGELFRSLTRFGEVNTRFLARHQDAITRQFRALAPLLHDLASADGELRTDISQLRTFLELFPKSLGGGPGGTGKGDYIQAEAVLCETLSNCHTSGEKGDVPGQGS